METQTLEMVCPKCNTPYSFAAHPSVSASDVGLTGKLLDLSIFRPACPSCGEKKLVEYPCVWHDDADGVLVELLPPGRVPQPDAAGYTGYHILRYVHSAHTFREKILAFTNGLDDRTVELLKAVAVSRNPEQFSPGDPDALLLTNADGEALTFLALPKDGKEFFLKTPMELYRELDRQIDVPAFRADGFQKIDGAWILSRAAF